MSFALRAAGQVIEVMADDDPGQKDAVTGIMGAAAALAGLVLVFLGTAISAFQTRSAAPQKVKEKYKKPIRWILSVFVASLAVVGLCVWWLAAGGDCSLLFGVIIGLFVADLVALVVVAFKTTYGYLV